VTIGPTRAASNSALSLLAASSIATLIAMAPPWPPHRLGHDPANGGGSLAAVIQGLLTVLLCMAIADTLVHKPPARSPAASTRSTT
jgi:Mg/Co/Ni transporter MgtE